jgi:hypothetical protein
LGLGTISRAFIFRKHAQRTVGLISHLALMAQYAIRNKVFFSIMWNPSNIVAKQINNEMKIY